MRTSLALIATLALSACVGGTSGEQAATPSRSVTAPASSPTPSFAPQGTCPRRASPAHAIAGGIEVTGIAAPGHIWALVQGPFPIPAGRTVKIVWKMTGGTGTPLMAASDTAGRVVTSVVPLAEHGGSTWRRPGEEWGSGWRFPSAGCWDVRARLGAAVGDVWFRVIR